MRLRLELAGRKLDVASRDARRGAVVHGWSRRVARGGAGTSIRGLRRGYVGAGRR